MLDCYFVTNIIRVPLIYIFIPSVRLWKFAAPQGEDRLGIVTRNVHRSYTVHGADVRYDGQRKALQTVERDILRLLGAHDGTRSQ